MTDRYAVFGNPVAHSRSPLIHAAFARQTAQDLSYEAVLAPLDGFAGAIRDFVAAGGKGANVTVPFKEEAFRLASRHSPRALAAKAVNTLRFDADGAFGDNTDGTGLVADIRRNLGFRISGTRILLLGAGGAARGGILPLLAQGPACLVIANRTVEKARALREEFAGAVATSQTSTPVPAAALVATSFSALAGREFDLVINATSAGLAGAHLDLPPGLFAPDGLAYDMAYGRGALAFLEFARTHRASRLADGLGMLVEQAAEAFCVWRGVRPETASVLTMLRGEQ